MGMTADQLALARMYLADPGSDAVQSILIANATGGSFTVTYSGQTTAAVAYNASAAVLQNALCALSNVGVGNLLAVDTAPYRIYFTGTLGAMAQPMLTVNTTGLTGTGAAATVTLIAAGGVQAFSDTELNALYAQAVNNFFLAICYGYRTLMADMARLNDYKAGQSEEKRSQVFDHLFKMAELYQEWAFAGQQVQIVRLEQVPPRLRAYPWQTGVPATSLSIRPPSRWGPWPRRGGG